MKIYEIGAKLRELRKQKGLTQEQLAKKANISRVTLGKLERGEVVSVSIVALDLILSSLNYEICFKEINDYGVMIFGQEEN